MTKVLERLPMSSDIEDVVLDEDDKNQSPNALALRSIKFLEQGSWHFTELEAQNMRLNANLLNPAYQDAIKWSENYDGI
ncbi:hypothetical protein [Thalassotalea eurytherma]|uniref:Uncharacterized protein n=1 Tax=Thalassotalea eurytherma TaxID=1144278 RepID=A0ABQ6H482_9GAMM|nr:hypothetical protein [Thalassotalea eurytherma]GLX81965.1 hypothetical protein theurythT_14170 [Thalassotalea eurytherma]